MIKTLPFLIVLAGLAACSSSGDDPPASTPSATSAIAEWRLAELDDDSELSGDYVPPHPGPDGQPNTGDERQHFSPGTIVPICSSEQMASGSVSEPLCYTSNPPTSGPHSATPQGFTNLENPAPKENIVHSMEHGGIYIWYNVTGQAEIDLIQDVVNENTEQLRFVGSTIYEEMEAETVALTSWTRIDKFPVAELTRERLQDFIDDHNKRFNPEGF